MPQDRAHRPDLISSPASGDRVTSGGPAHSLADIETHGTYFLGRYRVVDEIGVGGMASVHLARMDGPGGFQKWVAIKKIHPHLVEDESFVQMFFDEARVAARISHPNVATVFDIGKHDDTYWIAMEYLHGEPLRELMRRTEELGTAMPPEIACRIIADAAEGLHAAHELLGNKGDKLNLVHRDVTPHNLFVTYDGVTKVVDFGIAKFSSRMANTRVGTLKGKLAYMSPEQVQGESIDRRTDIFALGVVLWELTTGQRLFRMESDLDTLAKVQECNVPRPSTLIRGYPIDLEKIVMKALAKNRGERFRTARELSRALQSLLMRRGLFIASDEVESYTHSIFADRIQKRDAHLRWASEVTQTINVDHLLSKPAIGPELTSSAVQSAEAGRAPLPAAGAPPPPRPLPAAGMPPPGAALPPRPTTQPLPAPSAGPPTGAAFGPPGPTVPAPRPAAGAPPPPTIAPVPHPAESDGITLHSEPAFRVPSPPRTLSEPPTLIEGPLRVGPSSDAHRAVAEPSEVLDADVFEFDDDDDEDQAQTIVASFGEMPAAPPGGPGHDPAPPAPAPPPAMHSVPDYPPPYPHGPHDAGGFGGFGPSAPSGYGPPPAYTGEVSFADPTLGMPLGGGMPGHLGAQGYPEPYGLHGQPHLTGVGGAGLTQPPFAPPGAPPRLARDNRTMTVQRFRRRPSFWVVAAISCSIALLVAGVVIALMMSSAGPAPAVAESSGGGGGPGPFAHARAAFNEAVSAAPPSTPTQGVADPPPQGAPSAAEAAEEAASAAAPPVAEQPEPAPPEPATSAPPEREPPPKPAPRPAPAPPPVARKAPSGPGALTVVCIPKCDEIIDNGTSLGPGHIFNRSVPSGRHTLVLSAPNGVKKTLTVEVVPNQTREVRISMAK